MLISPPFLTNRNANDTDDTFIDRCMTGDAPGDGGFPVSLQMGWHGGLHLTAPRTASGGAEPVRAIADGKVVFKRDRTIVGGHDATDHPLYYDGGYTSDACVVIEHSTEIGATAAGVLTTLRFYSVYMHLHTVHKNVVLNQPIYRKDELGQPGNIAGVPDRIHFEIVGDDASVQAMLGRGISDALGPHGRTDAVFGNIYFRIPAGTAVYAENPQTTARDYAVPAGSTPATLATALDTNIAQLKRLNGHDNKTDAQFAAFVTQKAAATGPNKNIKVPAPYLRAVAATGVQVIAQRGTTPQETITHLTYSRGQATWTATLPDGEPLLPGNTVSVTEADGEYDLYRTAARRYPNCASAGYDLLRFGRIIGPDALHADDVHPQATRHVHFREVPCLLTDGTVVRGFVDLKAAGVGVYSDADMPPWSRWWVVQDFADNDSRCNSAGVRDLLDANEDGKLTAAEATAQLARDDVQRWLKRALVKTPTEWEKSSIDTRWGWLKQENPQDYSPALTAPMNAESFGLLKAFLELLCFWEQVQRQTQLPAVHWHFEPREFIKHFRKCGWLSARELAGLIPSRSYKYLANQDAAVNISWATALDRATAYIVPLNNTFRKYGLVGSERLAHFLGQVYIETDLMRTMREVGSGRPNSQGNWPAPAMQYYQVFYGRGMMQLTWPDNYEKYLSYRSTTNLPNHRGAYADQWNRITATSTHYWVNPSDGGTQKIWSPRYDPDVIATNPYNACDSAGWYWVSKSIGGGRQNINVVSDRGVIEAAIGRVSVLVNGGGFGYFERQSYGPFVLQYLSDEPPRSDEIQVSITRGTINRNIRINYKPQRG